MEKLFLLTLLLFFICRIEVYSQADESNEQQIFFGVKPEIYGTSGASFGFKLPSDLVLFGGIDYFHFGSKIEVTREEWDDYPYRLVKQKDATEATLSVLNLRGGAKFFLLKKNSIKGYLLGEISKPILSGSVEVYGKKSYEIEDFSENLSLWGFKTGFGVEYFFSQNFSLGGEFGLRIFLASFEDQISHERTIYYYPNPPRKVTETYSYDISMNVRFTYAAISLNFYF